MNKIIISLIAEKASDNIEESKLFYPTKIGRNGHVVSLSYEKGRPVNQYQYNLPKSIPWSKDINKVFAYMTKDDSQKIFGDNTITTHLVGGEIRMQNNIKGYLIRTKPNQDGVWTVKLWLASVNSCGYEKLDQCNLALAVEENRKAHFIVEAVGDYYIDTEEGYQAVSSALHNIAFNATDRRDTEMIYARVPGLYIDGMGGSAPFQADGTWGEGFTWYFRYRHGYASLKVGWNESDDQDKQYGYLINPHWVAGVKYSDDEYDGSLEVPEFTKLFCRLAKELKSEPFAYEFKQLNPDPKGIIPMPATIRAWDAKKARLELDGKPYPYNSPHFKDKEYAMEPLSEDIRVYPWPAPKFTVLDA